MTWRLRYTSVAKRQLKALPEQWSNRVAEEIDELQYDPIPGDLKPLRGTRSLYRLKIPPYRVIYQVHTGRNGGIVRIFRIEMRGPNTYRGFNPQ